MKRILLFIFLFALLNLPVFAHHHYNHPYYNHNSHSESVYLTHTEYKKTEKKFPNCNEHYLEIETIVNNYSDGSRRTFYNITIYNADGSVLIDNCNSVEHIVFKDEHYFIIKRPRESYKIIDASGNTLTNRREYSFMKEIESDRILVKSDKKYGIINLKEDMIVPIKYQKFKRYGETNFITKLNGYWGMVDINNSEIIKNDCEKVAPLYDTLLIKRYGKYGLANDNGFIFLAPEYDSIKKFHEYILVRKGDKCGLLDYEGKKVSELIYKKFKIDRNNIQGQFGSGKWVKIK